MAGAVAWERKLPILPDPAAALVTIELRDQSGRILPGLIVGDRWFVVGEEGRRYSIAVRNRSDFRLEIVLRSMASMSSMVGPLHFANAVRSLIPVASLWWKDFGKARKQWRPFASVRCANLTPLKNITTFATSASSASLCSTKRAATRGPAKKCAVASKRTRFRAALLPHPNGVALPPPLCIVREPCQNFSSRPTAAR